MGLSRMAKSQLDFRGIRLPHQLLLNHLISKLIICLNLKL